MADSPNEGVDRTGGDSAPFDRRQSHRAVVDVEVDCRCADVFLFAYITDVSALGIFIHANNPHPPGTRLTLRFTPPGDSKPLVLQGDVMWINSFEDHNNRNLTPGMGVKFVDADSRTRHRLLKTMRKLGSYQESLTQNGADG